MDAAAHQNWYQWTDGIETVSVAGSVTDSSVKALRSAPRQPEIAGGELSVDSYDLVWSVDAGTIASGPVPGDTITDSGSVVYTVMYVAIDSVGGTNVTYHCQCRKQVATT